MEKVRFCINCHKIIEVIPHHVCTSTHIICYDCQEKLEKKCAESHVKDEDYFDNFYQMGR